MNLLKNKIFIIAVCLVSFVLAGLIFADRVLGTGGNVSVASIFNMGGKQIKNVATPTEPSDAATMNYVSSVRIGVLQNVPNQTAEDALNPVVGQMWIRTDQ